MPKIINIWGGEIPGTNFKNEPEIFQIIVFFYHFCIDISARAQSPVQSKQEVSKDRWFCTGPETFKRPCAWKWFYLNKNKNRQFRNIKWCSLLRVFVEDNGEIQKKCSFLQTKILINAETDSHLMMHTY